MTGTPEPPGCRWCGVAESGHGWRTDALVGSHPWTPRPCTGCRAYGPDTCRTHKPATKGKSAC